MFVSAAQWEWDVLAAYCTCRQCSLLQLVAVVVFMIFLCKYLPATEMRYYRKTLRISYRDHVTNEEVRAKIQQAIGPDLLMIVKRCKLQWYGHVSHSSGLAKTILQGTVKGGRRQGR